MCSVCHGVGFVWGGQLSAPAPVPCVCRGGRRWLDAGQEKAALEAARRRREARQKRARRILRG